MNPPPSPEVYPVLFLMLQSLLPRMLWIQNYLMAGNDQEIAENVIGESCKGGEGGQEIPAEKKI